MSVGSVLAGASATGTAALAAWTIYRGWRGRVAAAAKKPFTTGQAAVDEAVLALGLKDKRLADTSAELEQQRVHNAAQSGQINELYTELGKMTAKNAELQEQLRAAKLREDADRSRISQLETQLGDVMKQLGLGH